MKEEFKDVHKTIFTIVAHLVLVLINVNKNSRVEHIQSDSVRACRN